MTGSTACRSDAAAIVSVWAVARAAEASQPAIAQKTKMVRRNPARIVQRIKPISAGEYLE